MGRTEKFRAKRTHGRGKKAGRGAGKRGGRGNAGLHKHRYISVVKNDPKHFGRFGFKRPKIPSERSPSTINVGQLEERLDYFLKKGTARKVGKQIEIDLTTAGFDKLLGSGRVSSPLVIRVNKATDRAASKISAQGGQLVLAEEAEKNTFEAE